MRVDKTIQLFQSLPQEMQEAAMQYIQSLADKVKLGVNPERDEEESQPHIRWADKPDATALQGLTRHEPLSLADIRSKAWKR